jgi:hypothetical protein
MITEQLQHAGLALIGLATFYTCNNPACSNMTGPSDPRAQGPLELLLVNGRSCVWGGCTVAHYCCRACQRQHWKQHRPVCKAIVAAAAASAAQ